MKTGEPVAPSSPRYCLSSRAPLPALVVASCIFLAPSIFERSPTRAPFFQNRRLTRNRSNANKQAWFKNICLPNLPKTERSPFISRSSSSSSSARQRRIRRGTLNTEGGEEKQPVIDSYQLTRLIARCKTRAKRGPRGERFFSTPFLVSPPFSTGRVSTMDETSAGGGGKSVVIVGEEAAGGGGGCATMNDFFDS